MYEMIVSTVNTGRIVRKTFASRTEAERELDGLRVRVSRFKNGMRGRRVEIKRVNKNKSYEVVGTVPTF